MTPAESNGTLTFAVRLLVVAICPGVALGAVQFARRPLVGGALHGPVLA